MENIKNEISKNLKLLKKLNEEKETTKKEIEEIEQNFHKLWEELKENKDKKDNNEIAQKQLNTLNEEEKQKHDILSLIEYQKSNINNNIDLLFNEIVEKELYNILHGYDNKKIGEKTKEKIRETLKNYVNNNYGYDVYFSFYKEYDFSRDYKVNFDFTLKNSYVSISKITKSMEIETKKIHDYFTNLNYNYIELKDIKKYSKKMLDDRRKATEKIEKLKKEIEETRNNYNGIYAKNKTDYLRIEYQR